MATIPPWLRRAAIAGALAFALLTTVVGINEGAPVTFLFADTGLGLLFIVAGLVAWERRPEASSGPILVACGVLWFVGSYAPTSGMPWSLLGFAFERYYDVLLALLALTFPRTPLSGAAKVVVAMLAGSVAVRTLGRLLIDPETSSDAWSQVQIVASAAIVLLALAVSILAWRRLAAPSPVTRRVLRPVVAAGVVAAISAAYDAFELAVGLATGQPLFNLPEPWHELVAWLPFVAVALVPLGFLLGSLRLRMAHGAIGPLAVEIDRSADPAHLERALQHALGDPSLRLLIWDDERQSWMDSRRETADLPAETGSSSVTVLDRAGRPIAAIVHEAALREDPGLVAAAAAVLRLAVDNERLTEDVRRQLSEVRESRARVIEVAESERRRIERDLHDGAQQRLVAVAMMLNEAVTAARQELPHSKSVQSLDQATEELKSAIDELRELARGIHPAILAEEGLGVAVISLARRSSVPVKVDVDLDRRLPLAVETAGYYVVAEALTNIVRHARARTASIQVDVREGQLEIEVSDDGDGGTDPNRGSGLRGLADRLDALSGRLEISSPPTGGTRIRAVIPCA